jgi:hypothetical protein
MKIVAKIKLHLLLHIPDDVLSIGPILGGITKTYEGFNLVFRKFSVHSNRLAPSRDIANAFIGLEYFRHLMSGGYWLSNSHGGQLVQASSYVQDFFQEWPILQNRMGWKPERAHIAGMISCS